MIPRMKTTYLKTIRPALMARFGFTNTMQAPRLAKIVVNMGLPEVRDNIKGLDQAMADLAVVTGQKPAIRRAKKSISNFRLREGMPIGIMVTLRGARMYEFMDRLVSTALPRIREDAGCGRQSGAPLIVDHLGVQVTDAPVDRKSRPRGRAGNPLAAPQVPPAPPGRAALRHEQVGHPFPPAAPAPPAPPAEPTAAFPAFLMICSPRYRMPFPL